MNGYFTPLVASWILALVQADQAKPLSAARNLTGQGPVRTDLHGDPLPPGVLSRIGTVRFRHAGTIYSIGYSPDGRTLAVSTNESIHLWDITTGKQLRFSPADGFYTIEFSPDGTTLVGQTEKGNLYLWQLKSNKDHGPLRAPFGGPVSCFALSPDNKTIALAKADAILLSDRTTGKELHKLEGTKGQTAQLVFSKDGKLLTIKSYLVEKTDRNRFAFPRAGK